MKRGNSNIPVVAVKDGENQRPIPTEWRPVFREIVSALASHDYQAVRGIPRVASISTDTAQHIENCIQDYGATLVALPEDTWNTSVCIWAGSHWDVLVDLWTKEEGQSDLVLSSQVAEEGSGFTFKIHMVYVP